MFGGILGQIHLGIAASYTELGIPFANAENAIPTQFNSMAKTYYYVYLMEVVQTMSTQENCSVIDFARTGS